MQETKYTQSGQMKFEGFYTYEQLRSNKEGGGVALSALKELNPAFVCDGGDEVEAITVDIHLKTMGISVTSAYGPQNSAIGPKKEAFWNYLTVQAPLPNTSILPPSLLESTPTNKPLLSDSILFTPPKGLALQWS